MTKIKKMLTFRKQIIATLTTLLIIFSLLYGFFLQQTVSAVVTRGEVSEEITQLRSDIGDAEQEFSTEIGSATMEKARELGFQSTQQTLYVTRSHDSTTLLTANVKHR